MLRRQVVGNNETWFDPALGLTGGSDGRFLSGRVERGCLFVWCDEGVVFETVAEERWPAEFYLKRSFRIGALQGALYRRSREVNAVFITALSFCAYSTPTAFLRLGWARSLDEYSD